ncbi:energy-coupling factor transporter transmembrane component T family protein [Paramicrobacterium chengjingii]|uniref:Energy-coupling factor transporter transmembrane protein EcfT n=1 Tax=Paramicrobacterium chengjingii TaxID=2769067 RepID=A0ABX6YGV0_9MICO|nr:energy-coupling factor transporter transmembrane component T [Microbacterium chengjingii]QPZ37622.1 energy-coupling factor transporter transmembrane protein EcfT [Microbacterium chengjingii]
MTMLGQYRARDSILHRLPAGTKLIGLVVAVLVVAVPPPSLWNLGGGAVLVLACYLVGRLGVGELWRQVLAIRWIIMFIVVVPLLFLPIPTVLATAARVVVVLLLAAIVTLTTRTTEILDAVEHALHPFRRFGVNPDRIGLMLALTIRTVPVVAGLAGELRDAQRARIGRLSVKAFVVPLLVQSLRHADDTAEALAARGVE